MLNDVRAIVQERGLKFGIVELHSEPIDTLARSGVVAKVGPGMIFDDLEDVIAAFSVRRNRPVALREDRAPADRHRLNRCGIRPNSERSQHPRARYSAGFRRSRHTSYACRGTPVRISGQSGSLLLIARPPSVQSSSGNWRTFSSHLPSAAARFTRYSRLALIASVTGIGFENLSNNSFRAPSAFLRAIIGLRFAFRVDFVCIFTQFLGRHEQTARCAGIILLALLCHILLLILRRDSRVLARCSAGYRTPPSK